MTTKSKWILLSVTISVLMSSYYVFFFPGNIKGDAIEYDSLSSSILQGTYSIDGQPTMIREPGYPVFRALIKTVSDNPTYILFIQLILYVLSVYSVSLFSFELDPEHGKWGSLGASLAYGLAFYTSAHISEILIGFLLSLIGLIIIKGLRNPTTKYWVYCSVLSSFLILTRYPYILVPLIFLIIFTKSSYNQNIDARSIIKNIIISVLIILSLISPWIIRNYSLFKEINIAGRSGAGLYARALKADASWSSLRDSYASALLGRAVLFYAYPTNQSIWLEQWGDWWRNPKVRETWGNTESERDKQRRVKALEIIFKDFNTTSKFVLWSGVDIIRFLQLPNPLPQAYGASFEGTYGPLAKDKTITNIQLIELSLVHIIQMLWFILICISTYLGFKKYTFRFLPGIFLLSLLIVHSVADNVTRYGAPLEPWILSGIFLTIAPIVERKIRSVLGRTQV